MATREQTSAEEKTAVQELMEANAGLVNTVIEAGYKAQTRGLNVARVFVEGAGRQQENTRRLIRQLADPALPWYSPERYSIVFNVLVENQNEALRIGREYIDELNAAAAEGRQTFETIVKQAGTARVAGQRLQSQSFATLRRFAGGAASANATA